MKLLLITISLISIIATSCTSVKEKTKEIINKSGETVGKVATEFIEGAAEGVEETLKCELVLSEDLQHKGLSPGKYSIVNDSIDGKDNQLTIYLIFENDFNASLTAKSYDKNGLETGRRKLKIEAKSGEAKYIDFIFDRRMSIDSKSKITIE